VDGILGTEKCYIRKAGMKYHVDLHARVDGDISVRDGHSLAHRLKDHLERELPGLGHVLIHIEPCATPVHAHEDQRRQQTTGDSKNTKTS
jgi:divalent metal cation (Fe/Co/Zn/Cd) transporter